MEVVADGPCYARTVRDARKPGWPVALGPWRAWRRAGAVAGSREARPEAGPGLLRAQTGPKDQITVFNHH